MTCALTAAVALGRGARQRLRVAALGVMPGIGVIRLRDLARLRYSMPAFSEAVLSMTAVLMVGDFDAKDLMRSGRILSVVESLILLLIVPLYWPLIGIA